MKLKMQLLKVVLLDWHSQPKIIFRLIKLKFGLKIPYKTENSKFLTALNQVFYKVSKNSLRKHIWMQKSIEFHLPHFEIRQLVSCICSVWSKLYFEQSKHYWPILFCGVHVLTSRREFQVNLLMVPCINIAHSSKGATKIGTKANSYFGC